MPRIKAILQSKYPYNITARCINREWFQIPMPEVWEIFCTELIHSNKKYELQIHSFVLMSNHFHLIATTPRSNISQCMHQFMYRTSKKLTRTGNRINQTYSGRHYKCILQHHNYYLNAYKYNYRNPVSAGICLRVEEYPYSSLIGVIHPALCCIPLIDDLTYSADPIGTLRWLNEKPDPAKEESVRYGLKRQYFQAKKHSQHNRSILGEKEHI